MFVFATEPFTTLLAGLFASLLHLLWRFPCVHPQAWPDLAIASGLRPPLSLCPGVWRAIATLIPSTFGMRGFVRLNTMGATLADVQLEYHAMWIQTVVYFFATCLIYRFQIISAHRHANERIHILKEKAKAIRERKEAEAS